MPGRGALLDIGAAKSDITSVRTHENDTGVSGTDTSAIGGAGRMGASGHGSLDEPAFINVADMLKNTKNPTNIVGNERSPMTSGEIGYDSGSGRTFGSKIDKV